MKEKCSNKVCDQCSGPVFHYRSTKMQSGNAVYGLGFIGSVVYFISTAPDFWMGVLGFLKALVWPAFMIYEAFKFLIK